jgi:hypothetical protein
MQPWIEDAQELNDNGGQLIPGEHPVMPEKMVDVARRDAQSSDKVEDEDDEEAYSNWLDESEPEPEPEPEPESVPGSQPGPDLDIAVGGDGKADHEIS